MRKLSIIIPYRNREQHFKKFVPHMNNFLKDKLNYEIVFIEQLDTKPFNRAKLLNIGFDLCKESDYFCFHDIDMLPISDDCNYSNLNGVCKLSYFVSQFNFVPRPPDELGGVTLIDKESFIKVNGYCNNYWGWGVEDNDFALRCKIKKVPFLVREGKFMSLSHKPNGDTYGDAPSPETIKNREYFNSVKDNQQKLFSDGLSSLDYTLINKIEKQDYKIFQVNL